VFPLGGGAPFLLVREVLCFRMGEPQTR